MRNILIQFNRFGPYHHARLRAAEDALLPVGFSLTALQTLGHERTYGWSDSEQAETYRVITAQPNATHNPLSCFATAPAIYRCLNDANPDAVFVAGYSTTDAATCLAWCKIHRRHAFLMSETREADTSKSYFKTFLKTRIAQHYHGALCGGQSHKAYLTSLGIPINSISVGYNVVDNSFFSTATSNTRSRLRSTTRRCLLCNSRLIPRKNLVTLISAYSQACKSIGSSMWPLLILGRGEEKNKLQEKCNFLGLQTDETASAEETLSLLQMHQRPSAPLVLFSDFVQLPELPTYYAVAEALIHPAISEPWGLVINEAMASGLPVLSSVNVGAAEALLQDGHNGLLFDPQSEQSVYDAIIKFHALPEHARELMGAAAKATVNAVCPTSAFGLGVVELLRKTGLVKDVPPPLQ